VKTIVVTGITGKTGYYFIDKLQAESEFIREYCFRFASRSQHSADFLESQIPLSKTYIGDIGNEQFCKLLCDGADVLVHIAGIRWSFPLLDVAAKSGVKRFILVHTTGMFSKYKNAAKPYIELEKKIHELAKVNGISVTILRPTMIYGTLDDKNISVFIRLVDKVRLCPVINGAKYELQPVHAQDLGNAYYSVLMHPETTDGKSYNLSGGSPIMLIDILKTLGRFLGKNTVFISVPFWLAYAGACVLYFLTLKKFDYREKVQRMIEPRIFSHEAATADFGYAPMRFEEGVKDEVTQYLKQRE